MPTGRKQHDSPEALTPTGGSSPSSSSGSSIDGRPKLVFGMDALMELAGPVDKCVTLLRHNQIDIYPDMPYDRIFLARRDNWNVLSGSISHEGPASSIPSKSAILDSYGDKLFAGLSGAVHEQKVGVPSKTSGSSYGGRPLSTKDRMDDDDDDLLDMLKPPLAAERLNPVPYHSPDSTRGSGSSGSYASSPSSSHAVDSPVQNQSSDSSDDDNDDEGWRRNVMNADDLQDLVLGVMGSTAPVDSSSMTKSPEGQQASSPSGTPSRSTPVLSGRNSDVGRQPRSSTQSSGSGSVASGLSGLRRLPSRSTSSSGAPHVMRSGDLADLMADLDVEAAAACSKRGAPEANCLDESGEGMFGSVAATWRADPAYIKTEKWGHGNAADGTLSYSSDGEGAEATIPRGSVLGPPQPDFRPLPASLGSVNKPKASVTIHLVAWVAFIIACRWSCPTLIVYHACTMMSISSLSNALALSHMSAVIYSRLLLQRHLGSVFHQPVITRTCWLSKRLKGSLLGIPIKELEVRAHAPWPSTNSESIYSSP